MEVQQLIIIIVKIKDYYTGSLSKKQFDDNPRQIGSWSGYTYGINDIINAKYNQKIK